MSKDKTNAPHTLDMGVMAKQFPKAHALIMNLQHTPGSGRDLYDRFDEAGVFIMVDNEHYWGYRIFIADNEGVESRGILYNSDDGFASRHQAEVAAFEDAFKHIEENIR